MLESQSCLISRALPSSCEQESKWIYMTCHLLEIANNKRPLLVEPLEFKGEPSEKRPKSEKHLDSQLSNEDIEQLPNDQPDSHRDNDDNGQSSDAFEFKEDPGHKEIESSVHSDSSHSNEDNEDEEVKEEDDGSQPPNDHSNLHDHNNNSDQYSDSSSLINPIGRDMSIKCILHCSRSDYGALASISRTFRSLIRSGEVYRLRRQESITEHWIYFSCNLLQWEAYDPYRRRWLTLPRMPRNEIFMSSDKESLAVGTDLLVFGREGYRSHIILRYSLLTNSWSSGVPMRYPRCLFGSASFGEKAIVAGGTDFDGNLLNSAELYDSENQTWVPLPSMNKPRRMCSGIFMDDKFYVIGGTSSNRELLTCGEEYDLDKGTWTVIPNMSSGLHGPDGAPPLLAVVNNNLYAADYAEKTVKKFDKSNKTWSTIGRLPERPDSVNGWGLAFRACGERIIVIGGPRVTGGTMIELNSWTPREGPPEWNVIASRRSGSFVYNCAVMGC